MPEFKLHYFDLRARGEPIRLIFAYKGVPFEDVRYNFEEWPSKKESFPFGQLPVLDVDGKRLAQSKAIYRYLGRKFGLNGQDEWETAKLDETGELLNDFMDAIKEFLGDQLRKEKFIPALEKFGPWFKRQLDASGSGFFGKKVTFLDFGFASIFEGLAHFEPEAIREKVPFLEEHSKKVLALPELKEYLSKRKEQHV
ncbi:Glutathione S-transferase-1 [Aphelenchoides fujianensis]|nr:Glutathione S-transferase-1 [Aphelenchoides fujianensis]